MQSIRVSTYNQLEQCLAIRKEVFVDEQQVPEHLEIDEFDESPASCHHILILMEGRPAATGRWRPYEQNGAKLQRIAVKKQLRGKGIGLLLLEEMESWAKELGFDYTVLDAQCQAETFYEKAGYTTVSPETFLDAGIPHVRMKKKL